MYIVQSKAIQSLQNVNLPVWIRKCTAKLLFVPNCFWHTVQQCRSSMYKELKLNSGLSISAQNLNLRLRPFRPLTFLITEGGLFSFCLLDSLSMRYKRTCNWEILRVKRRAVSNYRNEGRMTRKSSLSVFESSHKTLSNWSKNNSTCRDCPFAFLSSALHVSTGCEDAFSKGTATFESSGWLALLWLHKSSSEQQSPKKN